jgi:arginyl-tRNA synthetase
MIKDKLKQAIQDVLEGHFPEHTGKNIVIEYPNDTSHGDYSCNIALQLSKAAQKNPREVAQMVVDHFPKLDFVESIEIAGPGFINFFLNQDYLVKNIQQILSEGVKYGTNEEGKGQKILVEYSSPNTNKPLHLGHARNNFLGMATANLLKANGYDVQKTQIVNDRGIHICKSMLAYQKFGKGQTPESTNKKGDHFVGDYYVKYAEELKKDESIEEEVVEILKKWEAKDLETRTLWEKMNSWVYAGFNETYKKIGSEFDFTTHESEISEEGRAIVEQALKEGKVEKIEGGALAINLKDSGLGDSETGYKVLVRSNGTTIYMTQDIQLAIHRMADGEFNKLIYVVGNEQDYHFKVLFEVLRRFGYDWAENCAHLSYAMVNLPTGKMKSREGTSVDLDDLVASLEGLVDEEIKERGMDYAGAERKELIEKVALGALKYFILRMDGKSTMIYDPESSIDFQGNTGPYLQYTYARLQSILRKAPDSIEEVSSELVDPSTLKEKEELAVLRKLQLFPEIVYNAGKEYRLHLIANYLHELAQLTNTFYSKHFVLAGTNDALRRARLKLLTGVGQVIQNGLNILGIEAPEKM